MSNCLDVVMIVMNFSEDNNWFLLYFYYRIFNLRLCLKEYKKLVDYYFNLGLLCIIVIIEMII